MAPGKAPGPEAVIGGFITGSTAIFGVGFGPYDGLAEGIPCCMARILSKGLDELAGEP